jgi:hypothetical protein
MTAQTACDSGNFSNIEEAKAAQTRASIAQSHAIHAAVVDHEAKSVKRRAAIALANDVKCWNVHRKRELLRSALSYARAQHEATRRAVDGWSCLRDGFIGSVVMPPLYDRPLTTTSTSRSTRDQQQSSTSTELFGSGLDAFGPSPRYTTDPGETTATILGAPASHNSPPIVAIQHHDLVPQPPPLDLLSGSNQYNDSTSFHDTTSSLSKKTESESPEDVFDNKAESFKSASFFDAHAMLPFATASPIHEEDTPHNQTSDNQESEATTRALTESTTVDNSMTQSMQSLVDGLMTWGGTIDIEEELVLPRGMATSMIFDEATSSSSLAELSKAKKA